MKTTNGAIYATKDEFQKLMSQPMPMKIACKLARLGAELADSVRVIESLRVKLVRELGAKDEAGNVTVKPGGENWNKFLQEWAECLNQETELKTDIVQIPADTDIQIEPSVLVALSPFIEVA
jgi:hypothetical protein